jgi:hypothetical protein
MINIPMGEQAQTSTILQNYKLAEGSVPGSVATIEELW